MDTQPLVDSGIQEVTIENLRVFKGLHDPTMRAYVTQWEDFNSRNPKDAIDRVNLKTTGEKILEHYYSMRDKRL